MQLETDKNGLSAVFKEWQVPLVEEILTGKPMGSREATVFLKENNIRTGGRSRGPVSRASVINFLNYLVDDGLVSYTEKTGKGGHHRIYTVATTRDEFAHMIMSRFVDALKQAFPGASPSYLWPNP